jgi:hypothetical protein
MERDDRSWSRSAGDPGAEPDRLADELPPEMARFLEAQYQAMQRSLDQALEQRLQDVRPALPRPGGVAAGGRQVGRLGSLLVRFRPEIYFALTLALVGLLWFIGRGGSPEAGPPPEDGGARGEGEETGGSPEPAAGGTPTPSLRPPESLTAVREDSDGAWRRIVEADRDRFAQWLRALSEARGLDPSGVSEGQKRRFREYAEAASGTDRLSDELLGYARLGLFEYVYGLFERTRWSSNSPRFQVTLSYTGYDPTLLQGLLEELELAQVFPGAAGPQDPALQVAVLARRMAGELPRER